MQIDRLDGQTLSRFARDFEEAEPFLLSQDPVEQRIGPVRCVPWRVGIETILAN